MRKHMAFLLTLALMLQLLPFGALAVHPVPDVNAGGSITVRLQYKGKKLEGGDLTFFRVARIAEHNGDFSYEWTEEFADAELSLEDVQSAELAWKLTRHVRRNGLRGDTEPVRRGVVRYDVPEGELGLYLVVQYHACDGFDKINPFLIGVPNLEDGGFVYDVDATPKMDKPIPERPYEPQGPDDGGGNPDNPPDNPDNPPENPDNPPDKPDNPPETPDNPPETPDNPPKTPDEPELPKTGQLSWPVPVLAAAGLLLFTAGWALCRKSKPDEK